MLLGRGKIDGDGFSGCSRGPEKSGNNSMDDLAITHSCDRLGQGGSDTASTASAPS